MTTRADRAGPRPAKRRPEGPKSGASDAPGGRERRPGAPSPDVTDTRPLLLLGIGNILYGDEGLGVYVVHRLRRAYKIPSALRIIDGGAAGWHLEPYISGARRVVIVDSVVGSVGSIFRYSPHDVPSGVRSVARSTHELEVGELLRALEARGELPPTRIIAMGVSPAATPREPLTMALSPEIEARLPSLELVLLAELADAGVLLAPRGRTPSETRASAKADRRRRRQRA